MEISKNKINASMGRKKSDLVIKNVSIINVFTQSIDKKDIAIVNDKIIGVGKYEGIEEIDCDGLFAAPGFIDAHVHIESSMVTPEIFSHLSIKNGVTTVIADPHEIGNVLGEEGIEFMLQNSEKAVMDIFFMFPSCVPAVDFEDNGAILNEENLLKFINHPKILGLGEVMDVNAVTSARESMIKKIMLANKCNKNIDGHCPKINNKELNTYLNLNIRTDHECTNYKEALEKIANGMYVIIREGSATRDLGKLLKAVNNKNYHRFLFCTDDRHIEDLIKEGSIDNCIRTAIKQGLNPIEAYTIASFNAANCYNLRDRGAIAPGMKADLVIFEDIEKLNIKNVIKDGKFYNEKPLYKDNVKKESINIDYINKSFFDLKAKSNLVNVIKIEPGTVETKKEKREIFIENGFVKIINEDKSIINKIAVIERHKNTGKYSIGFIEGLGLRNAAIAQTIAHDSHNIIVVGDNDEDMTIAVNNIIDNNGGIVFISQGKILESLSLPIGGIITHENPEVLLTKIMNLNSLARKFGVNKNIDPFLTLGFMALPVIPEIKITARGLFDYYKFDFIDLFIQN